MPEPLELLICNFTAAGYVPGSVITVRRSPTNWGSRESIREWIAQGNSPATYPNNFRVIKSEVLSWEEAQRLLEPEFVLGKVEDVLNPGTMIDALIEMRPRRSHIRGEQLPGRLQGKFNNDDGTVAFSNPSDRAALLAAIREVSNPTEIADVTRDFIRPTLPNQAAGGN